MIQTKEKKCKGSYKVDHFEGCGKTCTPYKFGLCRSCFIKWCFDTEKGKEYYNKQFKPAATKKLQSESKQSIINYAGKLQSKVQEIARLIDLGHKCLARNKMALSFDGGHVFGKGSHNECKYNLHNIFAQDSKSNQCTKEDQLMTEGLRREFGEDYFLFVERLKNKPIIKHSKPDIAKMYKKACSISNQLRKDGNAYSKADRIKLRNKFNLDIGFYPEEDCSFKL